MLLCRSRGKNWVRGVAYTVLCSLGSQLAFANDEIATKPPVSGNGNGKTVLGGLGTQPPGQPLIPAGMVKSAQPVQVAPALPLGMLPPPQAATTSPPANGTSTSAVIQQAAQDIVQESVNPFGAGVAEEKTELAELPSEPVAAADNGSVLDRLFPVVSSEREKTLLPDGMFANVPEKKVEMPLLSGPFEAFLSTLLSIVHIKKERRLNRIDSSEDPEYYLRADQYANFKQVMALLVEIYGNPEEYKGQERKIQSLKEWEYLTSPTRGNGGSVEGDFEMLLLMARTWDPNKSDSLRRAVHVETEGEVHPFRSERERALVQYLSAARDEHLRGMLSQSAFAMAADGEGEIGTLILKTISKALYNFVTTDLVKTLDLLERGADILDGKVEIRAPKIDETNPLRLALKVAKQYGALRLDDKSMVEVFSRLSKADPKAFRSMMQAFETCIGEIMESLKQIGVKVIHSRDFERLKKTDPASHQLLTAVFKDYPRLLSGTVLRNIIYDLIRTSREKATSNHIIRILLKRGAGPILENILQNLAHRREMGALSELFEELQGENIAAPYEVMLKTLQSDPANYDFVELGEKELGVGKVFQVHRVTLRDGRKGVARIARPGIRRILDDERLMLHEMVPELSLVFFPHQKDKEKREMQTKKMIDAEYQEVLRELDVKGTDANQILAKQVLEEKVVEKTSEGNVTVEIKVPGILLESHKDSSCQIMEEAEDLISLEELVQDYPVVAKALGKVLYNSFWTKLVFGPLRKGGEGVGHRDLHGMNALVSRPRSDPNGGWNVRVWQSDWGLISRLDAKSGQDLVALNFAAMTNQPRAITDSLLRLTTTQHYEYRDVYEIVRTYTNALNKRSGPARYWSASEWIVNVASHAVLDFPSSLNGLNRAKISIEGAYERYGNPKDGHEQLMKALRKNYSKEVLLLAARRWPVWRAPLFWPRAIGQWTGDSFQSCKDYLASLLVKPTDKLLPGDGIPD